MVVQLFTFGSLINPAPHKCGSTLRREFTSLDELLGSGAIFLPGLLVFCVVVLACLEFSWSQLFSISVFSWILGLLFLDGVVCGALHLVYSDLLFFPGVGLFFFKLFPNLDLAWEIWQGKPLVLSQLFVPGWGGDHLYGCR